MLKNNILFYNDCVGLAKPSRFLYATPPPYSPNTQDQTVDFGGATWKGQPGGGWTLQRENPEATNYAATPGKSDINPATGKAYAIRPDGIWDDNYFAQTVEPQLTAQSGSTGGGGIPGGVAFNQPTIDLPKLYESFYKASGITDIERSLSDKTNAYNEQVAKIKDNPYLSEATMTGRISKLTDKFNADQTNIKNDIAMKKADIETKLNLQTQQFDINSKQAQLAWDQFNSLLSAGALDNASGEDIANLTRSTGISSSMILSAIGISKEKNKPKVNTQVIQVDDGTNVNAVVINSDTGQLINTQVIGQSKPEKSSGGATKTEIKAQETEQNKANLTQSIKNGFSLKELISAFSPVLTIDEIYRLYNLNSPFGRAKETLAQAKQGIYASDKGGLPKKK